MFELAPRASTPSPVALTPDLVEAYRILMTPVAPDDWDRMKRRSDAAIELARRAFGKLDRGAWEVVQVVEWRLQSRHHFFPTDPSDAIVLDALYRTEESFIPERAVPATSTTTEFVTRLQEGIRAAFVVEQTPLIGGLAMGTFSDEEWQWMGYQWPIHALHFAKFVALSSIRQPHAIACAIYHNLYDETGREDFTQNHLQLAENFVKPFGVETRDEDVILKWSSPESVALENFQARMFWKRNPGWGLGSAYVFEKLLPPQIDFIRDGLRRKGLSEERLEWFRVHIEGDVQHAAEWLQLIEGALGTEEDRRAVYLSAVERAERAALSWKGYERDFAAWKATGIPPHLPAHELRDATGL